MTESSADNKKYSALHGVKAVLWGFFGVRSKGEYQADISRLNMTQIIVTGIIGAILFVMSLVLVVYFVTR